MLTRDSNIAIAILFVRLSRSGIETA